MSASTPIGISAMPFDIIEKLMTQLSPQDVNNFAFSGVSRTTRFTISQRSLGIYYFCKMCTKPGTTAIPRLRQVENVTLLVVLRYKNLLAILPEIVRSTSIRVNKLCFAAGLYNLVNTPTVLYVSVSHGVSFTGEMPSVQSLHADVNDLASIIPAFPNLTSLTARFADVAQIASSKIRCVHAYVESVASFSIAGETRRSISIWNKCTTVTPEWVDISIDTPIEFFEYRGASALQKVRFIVNAEVRVFVINMDVLTKVDVQIGENGRIGNAAFRRCDFTDVVTVQHTVLMGNCTTDEHIVCSKVIVVDAIGSIDVNDADHHMEVFDHNGVCYFNNDTRELLTNDYFYMTASIAGIGPLKSHVSPLSKFILAWVPAEAAKDLVECSARYGPEEFFPIWSFPEHRKFRMDPDEGNDAEPIGYIPTNGDDE